MWKGQEYPIEIMTEKDRKEGPQEFLDDGPQGTYVTGCSSNITYKYTITCPKDYDGLCMCLMKPSSVPADAEEQMKEARYKEGGVEVNSEEGEEDVYLFKDEYYFGVIPSSDTLYMMRVDDMANEAVTEAEANNAAAENKKAKAVTPKTSEQKSGSEQKAVAETTTPSTGHPLNLDPDVDYGLPDWVKTEEDYAKYLGVEYISEEDWANYQPTEEELAITSTLVWE